jgi:hypothetical protein
VLKNCFWLMQSARVFSSAGFFAKATSQQAQYSGLLGMKPGKRVAQFALQTRGCA